MKSKKKLKNGCQILIHKMDEELYNKITSLAKSENRSVGKQTEYLLKHYFENQKEKLPIP